MSSRLTLRDLSLALALFAIAQASQLVGTSLVPRLRFLDEDVR